MRQITFGLAAFMLSTAPGLAQAHGHSQSNETAAAHLVLIAADCPQRPGNNVARWVNLHGHHALSVSSDDSSIWAGFDVFVDTIQIQHNQLPTSIRKMPQGTLQFRVTNASTTPFFMRIFNFNGECNTLDEFVVPNNGIVSLPVGPDTFGAYAYLSNEGSSSALYSDFRFNGSPIRISTLKDQSVAHPWNFCPYGVDCESKH